MATLKQYAYQVFGKQIAILERDFTPIQGGQSLTAPSIDLPTGGGTWKSPLSTVADALEVEYVYSPIYRIKNTEDVLLGDGTGGIDLYKGSDDEFLILQDAGGADFTALTPAMAVDGYIVLRQAGRWNGLHKIKALSSGLITTYTKYSGGTTTVAFEENTKLYYNVNALNDENDEIDLPLYLCKALVLFVKAKIAEDGSNIEMKEYFMKEFRKMVEKHESGKIWGSRRIMTGSGAIR